MTKLYLLCQLCRKIKIYVHHIFIHLQRFLHLKLYCQNSFEIRNTKPQFKDRKSEWNPKHRNNYSHLYTQEKKIPTKTDESRMSGWISMNTDCTT